MVCHKITVLYRQAVTKLKIKGAGISHMVSGKEMRTTYCVPFMPSFYFVTACRGCQFADVKDVFSVFRNSRFLHIKKLTHLLLGQKNCFIIHIKTHLHRSVWCLVNRDLFIVVFYKLSPKT